MADRINGTTDDDEIIGTGADEIIRSFEGDDIVVGGGGDDIIVTNEGDDELYGGDGDDELYGCEDDDILDGGAGADILNGGTGNDLLIFRAGENQTGRRDFYDGHTGSDTLILRLTQQEFAAAQADIANFQAYIEQTTNGAGESDGSFFFFETLNLAAKGIERLQVFVDEQVVVGEELAAENDEAETGQQGDFSGDVAENDQAPENSTYVLVDDVERGTLSFNPDGTFTFNPGDDFVSLGVGETATVSFRYRVESSDGQSAEATVTLTIVGENDAPTVTNQSFSGSEDQAFLDVDLLGTASDPDTNDQLTVQNLQVSVTVNGQAVDRDFSDILITEGGTSRLDLSQLQFLGEGETGLITLSYNVSDGTTSVPAQVTVSLTGANDAPTVSGPLILNFSEGGGDATFDLLEGIIDPDDQGQLQVSNFVVSNGETGAAVSAQAGGGPVFNTNDPRFMLNGNSLRIDADAANNLRDGETETVQFSYDVTDSSGAVITRTGSITFTGRNDAPVSDGPLIDEMSEDDGTVVFDLLDGVSDPDAGDTLRIEDFVITSEPMDGVTREGEQLSIDGAAFEALNDGESFDITFQYRVVDDDGASVTRTGTITVSGVGEANEPPETDGPISAALTEDAVNGQTGNNLFTYGLLSGASDPNADPLSIENFTLVTTDAEGFQFSLSGGQLTINSTQPLFQGLAQGETRTAEFTYDIVDGNGGVTPQTFAISVTGTNDAPVVVNQTFNADEDQTGVFFDLLEGATDVDNDTELTVGNIQISVLVDGDETDREFFDLISPEGGGSSLDLSQFQFLGSEQTATVIISYRVFDEVTSVPAQFVINVQGANDAPIADGAFFSEMNENDGVVTYDVLQGVMDVDEGDNLSIVEFEFTSGSMGGVSFEEGLLSIDGEFFSELNDEEFIDVTFEYRIEDSSGAELVRTGSVRVFGSGTSEEEFENQAPTVDGPLSFALAEDSFFAAEGAEVKAEDGEASDAASGSGGGTDRDDIAASSVYFFDLLEGAVDPDGDPLTVQNFRLVGETSVEILFSVANNNLAIDSAQAAFNFLDEGQSLTFEFAYDIVDGNGGFVTQTATVMINGRNDAPDVEDALSFSVVEDALGLEGETHDFTFDLLQGASDAEGHALSVQNFVLTGTNSDGFEFTQTGNTLSVNTAQTPFQSLAEGQSASLEFSYEIVDSRGAVTTQTVVLEITGRNDAPTPGPTLAIDAFSSEGVITFDALEGSSDIDDGDVLTLAVGFVGDVTFNEGAPDGSEDAVSVSASGEISFDPSAIDFADASSVLIGFTVIISDGTGSASRQIEIMVINDGPPEGRVPSQKGYFGEVVTDPSRSDDDLAGLMSEVPVLEFENLDEDFADFGAQDTVAARSSADSMTMQLEPQSDWLLDMMAEWDAGDFWA